MNDPLEHKMVTKKNPKARVADMSKDEYKKYSLFRALLWDAIDSNKDISIVELEKKLEIKR